MSVATDLDGIRHDLSDLRKEIKSLLTTYNENNVHVQQGLISTERWQSSHEKLDEERWEGIKEKLSELKGMLETIPVKIELDLKELREVDAALRARIDVQAEALVLLRGVWLAISLGVPVIFGLIEFYLHSKG